MIGWIFVNILIPVLSGGQGWPFADGGALTNKIVYFNHVVKKYLCRFTD